MIKYLGSKRRSIPAILDAVAAERRRIERNLHDGVQQQLVAIGRAQHIAQGVAAGVFRVAGGEREQMEVMIAEYADGSITEPTYETENRKRVRPPVDEIAQTPQLIGSGIEADRGQQVLELARASLNVSYHPAHIGALSSMAGRVPSHPARVAARDSFDVPAR